jgi:uncharacterized Zn finger protein
MGWYDFEGAFPPYVSAAEKKARAARELARLTRKARRVPEPVVVAHRRRQLATTFWGKAWCDNLERYADLANRLGRGRAYVRNGLVLDLVIGAGTVEAYVAGSELYTVRIGLERLGQARWRAMVRRCTGRIDSLVGLLRGELPADVLAVLVDAKEGVFPEPREISLDCSCPDRAAVCKHVAAVLYGVGIRLDERPELFFVLRQVDQADLLTPATAARSRPAGAKRIAGHRLADVFGIDLVDEPRQSSSDQRRGGAPVKPRAVQRRATDS